MIESFILMTIEKFYDIYRHPRMSSRSTEEFINDDSSCVLKTAVSSWIHLEKDL